MITYTTYRTGEIKSEAEAYEQVVPANSFQIIGKYITFYYG